MKKLFLFFWALPFILLGQNSITYFKSEPAFIKNYGQFDKRNWLSNEKIEYGIEYNNANVFFSKKGVTYRFDKYIKNPELIEGEFEKEGENEPKKLNISELINIHWLNANPDVKIIAEGERSTYHSYAIKNANGKIINKNYIKAYKKIIYKNLYNNIDLEYKFHHNGGFEYSFILHKGANPSDIKMKYTTAHTNRGGEYINIELDSNGELQIKTSLSSVTEHMPMSFYSENHQKIKSHFVFEKNILSFSLGSYDNTKGAVIDPWVVSPNFNTSTAVWEVETDASGNVYAIGGETNMELRKYDSNGNQLWTYNTPWDTSSVWLGTLATDENGTSYITAGTAPAMERIDNNGNQVWHIDGPQPLIDPDTYEWWSITFNCDKTKLIVGGTYAPNASGTDYYASIYDIDLNNGNILNRTDLTHSTAGGFSLDMPIEVRSIAPTNNSKYIFLTHQKVGAINQNLGFCPNEEPDYMVDNQEELAYKCENYLPEHQNGGGLKAIIANDNYFYTHTGDKIRQWDVTSGALINTVTIPGGTSEVNSLGKVVVHNSGLSVDANGNVYAGADGSVIKFDENLNILQTSNVGFTVYDVSVNSNGEVIACGAEQDNTAANRNGKIAAVSMNAGGQYAPTCCDVNICHPDTLCLDDSPITVEVSSPGGTFSGDGITDANNGTFDPSVAGVGTHTITYSKACGSETVDIEVLACTPIDVCDDGTNYTASGGTFTINWYDWETISTDINSEQECIDCPNADPEYTLGFYTGCSESTCNYDDWVQIGSGTSLDPANINSWPILITDGIDTVIYNSASEVPACSPCTQPTLSETHTDETCSGDNTGSIDLTITPGSGSSYSVSWSGPNSYTANTEDISNLGAGTYTVTVTDNSNSSCTATLQVTIQEGQATEDASFTASDFCEGNPVAPTVTGLAGGTFSFNPQPSNGETINPSTGLISGAIGGNTYTIEYTTTGSCPGTSTQTITVFANPTPTISGSTTFCTGSSTTLDAGAGYASYAWSPNNETTQTITVNTNGTYSVTVTDNNGCSGNASVDVTEASSLSPHITGVAAICSGASTILDAGAGYATYTWSPNGETSQTINVTTAGTYSVTVTDNGGCSGTDQVTVTEHDNPTPVISGSTSFCSGSSTMLDAGAGYSSYIWNTNANTQTINVNTAGTYSVTVTDNNGCSGSSQVNVTESASLSPVITGGLYICSGSSTILDAGAGFTSYQWNTGANSQSISVNTAGTYSVTVSDNSGCTGTDQVTVEVNNLVINASEDITVCDGSPVNISANVISGGNPPFEYHWSNGSSAQTISVNPTTSTIYTVYVTDASGCTSNTESVTVNVTSPVELLLYASQDSVCPGDPVLISTHISNGVPPYVITDNDGNVVNTPYTIYVSQTTDLTYTVTDACGSSATDNITIGTYPVPYLSIQADKLNGCEPLTVNFIEESASNDNYTYKWYFGDNNENNLSFNHQVTHIFESPGVYDIGLTVTTDKGCESSLMINDMIEVYQKPDAKFQAKPEYVTIIDPVINFYNLSQNASSYIWSFGDGDSSNTENPIHKYLEINDYKVSLVAISENGCRDSVYQNIKVDDVYTIYVPEAFSPDNDGINDVFICKAHGIDLDNFNMKVYDRWGEIIFETDDIYTGWDGKVKGGNMAENGSYIWLVTFKTFSGTEYQKRGTVTLFR